MLNSLDAKLGELGISKKLEPSKYALFPIPMLDGPFFI
jgi:hypothetical protein